MTEHEKRGERDLRDELRDSEKHFRLLVDSVEDYAIFMLDTGGRVASWNSGAQRIKGYSAGEIVGKHFSVFYPREDVEAGKCERELEVASREGRVEDEGPRVRKDGTTFWASVVITALRDGEGRLIGFGKVTRDLTARVQAEQERLRLAQAEAGDRRKEELLAIMGHELRNPLAPMVTAMHLIKLRRGNDCAREIGVVERQLGHMLRLLDDLLDLSRMLREKVKLTRRVIDVGLVLADAVQGAAALMEGKQHRLQLDLPPAPLFVEVDADRMTQVFSNLLNNAAKYTDPLGLIRVRATGDDEQVVVAIEDTGIGIDPGLMPRLFQLFTQGEQGLDRQLGGLGIGLAVAHRLVDQHGGTLTAESEGVGKGSRFTVQLPRADAPALAAEPLEHPPAPMRRAAASRRVLLVDDNEDSNEMMREYLEGFGHDVRVAHDGQSGLELAREFAPDIALLDLGLPGMDGFELARRLRLTPQGATIPLVAVSGYARDVDRQKAMKAGFSEHFAKPIELSRLEDLLERAGR